MVKYEFKNYITHKKSIVISPEKDDYFFGTRWLVEYYKLGEFEELDWKKHGTQGTGCADFVNENSAIRSALHYIKH